MNWFKKQTKWLYAAFLKKRTDHKWSINYVCWGGWKISEFSMKE